MKDVLTICPTRGRPHIIHEMIDSFLDTASENNALLVYIHTDDPDLPNYKRLTYKYDFNRIKFLFGPRLHLAEAYNTYATRFHAFDYYAPINDDHVFLTKGWDEKLAEIIETQGKGWGIAGADDKLTDWTKHKHPSGCLVSGNIVRTLGYMIYPTIRHIGIDTYFMKLAESINCLFLTKDVVIEHRHWVNGKRTLDANYKWVYSKEEQSYGMEALQHYLITQYEFDVRKLKKARA